MYAHVIPLTRIPKPAQAFTYSVPPEIEAAIRIGQIVRIPWRKSACFGIVQNVSQTSDFARVSAIAGLQETEPSWTPANLNILTGLAERHHVSWSVMALSFSPDIPTRKRVQAAGAAATTILPAISISKSRIKPIQTFAHTITESGSIFKFRQHGERLLLYRELCTATKKSLLFLLPQIEDAQELHAYLSAYYPEETLLWDARAAMNRQWETWQRCKTTRIVIATRSGAFLPCANLAYIIVDQEDQAEHKQWEAAPHYDARVCAQLRAEAEGALFLRTAAVPRVESTDPKQLYQSEAPLQPVQSVTHAGRDLIHPTIVEALQATLEKKQSCLVVCTHKGGHRLLRCLDCQHRWNCQSCKIALYEHERDLRCPICGTASPLPSACPSCRSQNIRPFGAGSERVKSYLQAQFQVPVQLWDAQREALPPTDGASIVVSTPYACKTFLRRPDFATVLLFHPESLLFQPDYRANENYYRLVQWHRLFLAGSGRQLFIQTKLPPENQLQQQVIQDNYEAFFVDEIGMRKQLRYPPASSMIKFIYRGAEAREAAQIELRLRRQHPSLRGPFIQLRPAATYWLTKVSSLQQGVLDNPLDSIYNKLVIDVNPHQF